MIKVFALLPKKPDLNDDEFHRHWRDVHAPLLLKNSAITRYIQSHHLPQPFPGFPADIPYAGVAELWFTDLDAAFAQLSSSAYREHARLDEPNFLDASGPQYVFTRENIVIPGPQLAPDAPVLKALFFVKHRRGKSRAHFQDYWRNKHAPLVIGTPALQRYVQCHVIAEANTVGQATYDGVGELWFADYEAYERCWNSAEIQDEQLPDTLNFVGGDPMGFFVKETQFL